MVKSAVALFEAVLLQVYSVIARFLLVVANGGLATRNLADPGATGVRSRCGTGRG
jgi:hypothetical protein